MVGRLEAERAILTFFCACLVSCCGCLVALILIKGLLKATQFIVEVDKDVGAGDLDQRIVPRPQEYDVLLVQVLEERIAQDLVDALPIARDQALLVQVDKVALDLLIGLLCLVLVAFAAQMVPDLVTVRLFQ